MEVKLPLNSAEYTTKKFLQKRGGCSDFLIEHFFNDFYLIKTFYKI
jgi:hypothetical protein